MKNAAVQTDYSWFTDQVISEVIDDLVAENPLGRENWDRKAASDYLYNGGLRIYATVDTEVQTALENVWLEGKYWEPMPIENYVDPNKPDDTPHTITTQAAGVVINYKGGAVRRRGRPWPEDGEPRLQPRHRDGASGRFHHEGRRGLPVGH